MEKKDDRERELDSFLERAQESRGKRAGFDDWENAPKRKKMPSGNYWNAILVAGVLVVIAVLYFAVKEVKGLKGIGGIDKGIEKSSVAGNGIDSLKLDQGKYQAIFLTNGQVYFGKINNHDESYVEVLDIYYLQVKPVLQQGDNGNNNDNKNPQAQQQTELSLVKLGSELHGPMDRMSINKDQIVFVEDLKDDSKVTEAIRNYQNGNKQ